jgi:hypothetical protein
MSSLLPIWFRLFDSDGKQWPKTRAKKVLINPLADVDDFLEAVKAKYDEPNYLQNIPSGALSVYKNKQAFDEKEEPLKPSLSIIGLGQNDEELALIVVAPSTISSVAMI